MPAFLDEISQVTIYFKNQETQERVNEVALYQPLANKPQIDETNPTLLHRKWSFSSSLPFSKRMLLKIQSFVLQKIPFLKRKERQNIETKFKTVVAILLSQEALAEFFLEQKEERESFFSALQTAANTIGYKEFSLPGAMKSAKAARFLTTISQQNQSLLDDLEQLNVQMSLLDPDERDEILYLILNAIKRKPLTSVIEVAKQNTTENISLTTVYGKLSVTKVDKETGKIHYKYQENESQPSIKTSSRNAVINQHFVMDSTKQPKFLVGISGELINFYRVLEQVLFLLPEKGEFFLEKTAPVVVEDKVIVFTSLFSWNEYEKIMDEHFAIEKLHGQTIKLIKDTGETRYYRLSLHHQNIPFNAFNKFPAPGEIKASINDLNDKTLLFLSSKILKLPKLQKLAENYEKKRNELDFIRRENDLINIVDQFHRMKIELLDLPDDSYEALAIKALISKRLPNHKPLHAIDAMIYFSVISNHLGFTHTVNCEQATDRAAGALSIIKAQNAYTKLLNKPFLPGISSEEETSLFRVFYSMYLVFEEPELNAGLCTGFIGEKYYQNFIQRNPETTFYLIPWLKAHPEMYLGLSHYR